ncbi:MAG: hypothetical protein AABY44_09020 [Nitrospirota bacterium]
MQDIKYFRERLYSLIEKFDKNKPHYLSKGYLEAQLRIDFINPFFKALGWDIENKANLAIKLLTIPKKHCIK